MAGSVNSLRQEFLREDQLQTPITPVVASKWNNGKRICALAGMIGFSSLRILNLNPVANAFGCFGAGFSAFCALTIGVDANRFDRIRQISSSVIGQGTIFGLSQAWDNDLASPFRRAIYVNTITALFGANIQMMLGWLEQRGALRIESQSYETPSDVETRKLQKPSRISENWIRGFKICASGGLTALSILSKDPILRTVSGWFSPFFFCQVVGEKCIQLLDRKIAAKDTGSGTYYRTTKTATLTAAYIGQIFSFLILPWQKQSAVMEGLTLRFSGAALGFFDGILEESMNARTREISVKQLTELQKMPPIKQQDGKWKYLAYRIWKFSVPLFSIGGISGFCIWQLASLQDLDSRIALASLLLGFASSSALGHYIDQTWDPKKNDVVKDKLMSFFWFSQRILSIDPLFLYYALINAVKIDNKEIASEHNPSRISAICFAWLFYGMRMGLQIVKGASERRGCPLTKRDTLGTFNAAEATAYAMGS